MVQDDRKVITTRLPSYLEALLEDQRNLKLVYRERKKVSVSQPFQIEEEQVCNEISELELTGTPLETDLGTDDTACSVICIQRVPNWRSEEAEQYPLTLSEARSYINSQLRSKKSSESLYCVCDGNDQQKTVGLGITVVSNKLTRTLVYILPSYKENHEAATTIEYLKNDHRKGSIRNMRINPEIRVSITRNYNLFGCNLKNCSSLSNVEHNGNISIEELNTQSNKVAQNNSNVKMNCQVIIGHNNSPVIGFWEDMCRIQSYIKQLECKLPSDSTIINPGSNLDYMDVTTIISDLFNTVGIEMKEKSETLDLENLRPLNILDKLWNALKSCKTVSDLRDCFHFFFEELAQRQMLHLLIEDKSPLGEIVNGIIGGKVAVPTLSFSQSLELFIDLGLEKLKNDYVFIISHFYGFVKEAVLRKFNEFNNESSTMNSTNNSRRRTKISINPKMAMIDLTISKLKLSYLDAIHKTIEFMFLYKENFTFMKECFYSFCEVLCNTFILQFQKIIQVHNLKEPRLCHFSFNISSIDLKQFIKNNSPEAFSVKMVSKVDLEEIVTVYHFSEYPIFPPSIFTNYDVSCDNNETKFWYCAKLVKYIHNG